LKLLLEIGVKIKYIYIIFNLFLFLLDSKYIFCQINPKSYTFDLSQINLTDIDIDKVKIIEQNGEINCFYLGSNTLYKFSNNGNCKTFSPVSGWFITNGHSIINISNQGISILREDSFSIVPINKSEEIRLFIPNQCMWNDSFELVSDIDNFIVPDKEFQLLLFSYSNQFITRVHSIDLKSKFIQPVLNSFLMPNGLVQKDEIFPYLKDADGSLLILNDKLYYQSLYFYDLNRDGLKDILIQEKNGVEVFINNGIGKWFYNDPTYLINDLFLTDNTEVMDIDGDGYSDLVSYTIEKTNFKINIRWGKSGTPLEGFKNFSVSERTIKKIIPFGYGFFDIDNDGRLEFLYARYEMEEMTPIGFVEKLINEGMNMSIIAYDIKDRKFSAKLTLPIFMEFQPFPFFFFDDINHDKYIEICVIKRSEIQTYKIIDRDRYSKVPSIKIRQIDGYCIQKNINHYFWVGIIKKTQKVLVFDFY